MTLWIALPGSVLRTAIIAALAVWCSRIVFRQIASVHTTRRKRVWIIVSLVPLVVPDLIVGFTYRMTAQKLTDSALATECLYALLLLVRATSVGVLVRLVLPSTSVTDESLYSWAMLRNRFPKGWRRTWWRLLATGPWRSDLVAGCLIALTVFQDFETAALVQVDRHPVSWTVWIFDANAGNQQLSHSLRLLIGPLVFQILLIIPGLWLVMQRASEFEQHVPARRKESAHVRVFSAALILTGVALVAIWPFLSAVPELFSGITLLKTQTGTLAIQQASSLGFSIAAAMIALMCAIMLRQRTSSLWTLACLLPGLCGSLTLSLMLLAVFQLPGMRMVWDTWLPLLSGQAILMLPRAYLLVVVLESRGSAESRHSSHLLLRGSDSQRQFGRTLQWRMEHLRWLLCGFMLVHWCSWDVTTSSVLRPVSVEPVVTRLYREMHFSRTESLTVLAFVTLLTPVVAAVATGWVWRTVRRFIH